MLAKLLPHPLHSSRAAAVRAPRAAGSKCPKGPGTWQASARAGRRGWTGRRGSEVVVDATTAGGLARLAGRLQGLALPIPVGIDHRLQLIEQLQHPEGTEVGGDRGAGLAALHIGHGEAAHAQPLGNILQPPVAAQPGGADVAPQPLQGLLHVRRRVLNEGTELGQAGEEGTRVADDNLTSL